MIYHIIKGRLRKGFTYFFLVFIFYTSPASAQQVSIDSSPDTGRIVVITDIHGAYKEFTRLLLTTSLVNNELEWSGGKSGLVIIGDVLDRGADSRKALDLIIRLEKEAELVGGKLHFILGNHEIMNLVGDLRYVSKDEFSAYIDDEEPVQRELALQRYLSRFSGLFSSEEKAVAAFNDKYPPGFFGHRKVFLADGIYGSWLIDKPIIGLVGSTAFVHGGIAREYIGSDPKDINTRAMQTLKDTLNYQALLVNDGFLDIETDFYRQGETSGNTIKVAVESGDDVADTVIQASKSLAELEAQSPLYGGSGIPWYRGMVACNPPIEEARVNAILDGLGVEQIIIGHTPVMQGRVLQRFDGKLIRADTGMLRSYYHGQPSAVIIENSSVSVTYIDPDETAMPEPQQRNVYSPASGYPDSELEILLAELPVTGQVELDNGRLQITLQDQERKLEAIFTPAKSQGRSSIFVPEVAAYRLDKILNFQLVPVSVLRDINGMPGALTLKVDNFPDEKKRAEERQGGAAWCPLRDQFNLMYVFDSLINNTGRAQEYMQYNPATWQLILTGNHNVLERQNSLPRYLSQVDMTITDTLYEDLQGLNTEMLDAFLADVLDSRRRQSILNRRDAILKRAIRETY